MRGTVFHIIIISFLLRITPACAGNRHLHLRPEHNYQDHPRVCGEQLQQSPSTSFITGSPPRVRGTALISNPTKFFIRITPACAGNRRVHQAGRIHTWDHPRVCGEQTSFWNSNFRIAGSPPRVRGTAECAISSRPT